MPQLQKKTNKKKQGSKVASATSQREVIYPEIKARICLREKGTGLTEEQAKKLLGWEEEPAEATFGEDFLLKDIHGKKIRCSNDIQNRPLSIANYEALLQEILTGKWRMNCENMIIGKTGITLNCQHRLIALVLACQKYRENPENYKDWWDEEPILDTMIAFGCDESDETVNTMDTCKPRSLWEVICRSHYFADLPLAERKVVSRRTADCIKFLWHRTGAFLDAFRPRRTHSESLHFIERHQRTLAAVKHITEENGTDKISRYIVPGYAAALLYLMGTSETEREKDDKTGYSDVAEPGESLLNFSRWEQACDFWTMIAAGDKQMDPIREALGKVLEGHESQGGTPDERVALLAKAWNAWIENGDIEESDLILSYNIDGEGRRTLTECPVVQGIDLGNPEV